MVEDESEEDGSR